MLCTRIEFKQKPRLRNEVAVAYFGTLASISVCVTECNQCTLLEKPVVLQILTKQHTFYEARRFIDLFTE